LEAISTGYREMHLKDANGKEIGVLKYDGEREVFIHESALVNLTPHIRIGNCKRDVQSGIEDARNRGIKEFRSDTSVSNDARHVWQALAREGYPVYQAYTNNFNANGSGGIEYTIPYKGKRLPTLTLNQLMWWRNLPLTKGSSVP